MFQFNPNGACSSMASSCARQDGLVQTAPLQREQGWRGLFDSGWSTDAPAHEHVNAGGKKSTRWLHPPP
jgi:hypothetical protein